ncbi:hypothetical protein C4D60_Mb11t18140 [Musa balbisiana]|uniref:Uncharacterized protein n=1 Tax=Musa balbisiana TaxID=52838 RepID=A0A4S8J563_MUSBA|nr:hypothetical protein C4D60_Mb11t18140 [Musa balbisiana]
MANASLPTARDGGNGGDGGVPRPSEGDAEVLRWGQVEDGGVGGGDPAKAEADVKLLLDEAGEACQFMSDMIAQVELISSGGYVVKPTKEHAGATLEIPSEDVLSKST